MPFPENPEAVSDQMGDNYALELEAQVLRLLKYQLLEAPTAGFGDWDLIIDDQEFQIEADESGGQLILKVFGPSDEISPPVVTYVVSGVHLTRV